ncbi:nicotinamide riboside transporter PnuC [Porphyromonas sp.]|uniref:nicotinamide riboside transporter PnuC n=1 Tax=Porphyromonas sp. TaxID=1924944 RepID=UPI0026DB9090|nr:nicotinamide riboside transporter PnuC [Porphyromonas sp.]MDO4771488.1 nicotinamide riboside transporter PnuC [Porphyromonas sp.]
MDTIQIIEIVAAVIGILYVLLEIKASIWLWPVGVILPFFYIYISFVGEMYGNIFVNIYYLIAAIWGWWLWHHRRNEAPQEDKIAFAPRHIILYLLGIAIPGIAILTPVFKHYTDSPYPFWDVTATVIAFVGMWLLAKKYMENWYCWFVSNAIFCILFLLQGFYITCGFFVIYTVMALVGFFNWRRLMLATER